MEDQGVEADEVEAGTTLQLRRIGNSVGLIFPKETLTRLRLQVGDRLYLVEQPERELKLSPYDPKHARALEIARQGFREYSDTYRELAK